MRWHITRPFPWLMLQWGAPIFLSVGMHVDFRAPYVDLHIGAAIVTIGRIHRMAEVYQSWWCSQPRA